MQLELIPNGQHISEALLRLCRLDDLKVQAGQQAG